MASVKGSNFTNATADPVIKTESSAWTGKIRVQYDSYEACYYTDEILEKLHHNWTKRGFDRVVQERKTNERKA